MHYEYNLCLDKLVLTEDKKGMDNAVPKFLMLISFKHGIPHFYNRESDKDLHEKEALLNAIKKPL